MPTPTSFGVRLLLAIAVPSLAAAQSFNLDIGDPNATNGNGSPSSSYGGAAANPGHWDFINAAPLVGAMNYTTPALTDITGTVTGVTIDFDVINILDQFTVLSADEPNTFGDDALLMDDIVYCVGAPYTITFNGLEAGDYEVYTYAMAPDSASLFSLVDVPLGVGGVQQVGGAFPGMHQHLVTYALHTYSVDASGMLVIHMDQVAGSDDSLNGMQLVGTPAGGPIGTNYCGPANLNSTGQSGIISAFGSELVAVNDVRLDAAQLALNQNSYFITSMTQGFVMPPGSQGFLCLGGTIGRFNANVLNTGGTGEVSLQIDLTDIPIGPGVAVQPGESWYFQLWYRDVNPMATSNFTDGLCITFL